MLEPGHCKLHLPPVHSDHMGSTTTTLQEAADRLAEGVEEDSILSAGSCFDRESPKCTGHKIPRTMTVKMSDCSKNHIFYFSFH